MKSKSIQNFGQNLRIEPAAFYDPKDAGEVLSILARHSGEPIRVIGSLHSWSEAPVGEGVILSLRHFQTVELQSDGQSAWVGAGCQIKTILDLLKPHNRTRLTLGLVTEQTIAGAISTGTHGSGRQSLSHYVEAIRVARYDVSTGAAIIDEIVEGNELRAGRCSLGYLGVILAVRIKCREPYRIEEHFREYPLLNDVFAAEEQFPLQQFFLTPWRWTFMAQHRREVSDRRSVFAWLYRFYWFTSIDLGLHLLILASLRLIRSDRLVKMLYRFFIPFTVLRNCKVVDDSSAMLIMEHEIFRHIEMELFVPRLKLAEALQFLKSTLLAASGSFEAAPDMDLNDYEKSKLESLRGKYCHHYPICIRRVLPDDTLISMSSGDNGDWYAISLISYALPTQRQGFFQIAEFLAETMARKFGARPHWGKVSPLRPEGIVRLYPQFGEFVDVCKSKDPRGVFRNKWSSSLFAVDPGR